jgi:hypothetical protein
MSSIGKINVFPTPGLCAGPRYGYMSELSQLDDILVRFAHPGLKENEFLAAIIMITKHFVSCLPALQFLERPLAGQVPPSLSGAV